MALRKNINEGSKNNVKPMNSHGLSRVDEMKILVTSDMQPQCHERFIVYLNELYVRNTGNI
jgi:hypothetical protein